MQAEDNLALDKPESKFAVPYYEIAYDKFFQFGLSVDCVVFGYHEDKLKVLVIKKTFMFGFVKKIMRMLI